MAHEVETAAYAGNTPAWHKLGNVFAGDVMTTAEAMELAGLDWTVELQPVYARNETFDAFTGSASLDIRADRGQVRRRAHERLQDARRGRQALPPDPAASRRSTSSTPSSTRGPPRSTPPARSQVASAPSWSPRPPRRSSSAASRPRPIWPYLFFRNSYDGTSAVQLLLTKIRVVCANTENWALATARQQLQHPPHGQLEHEGARGA